MHNPFFKEADKLIGHNVMKLFGAIGKTMGNGQWSLQDADPAPPKTTSSPGGVVGGSKATYGKDNLYIGDITIMSGTPLSREEKFKRWEDDVTNAFRDKVHGALIAQGFRG
jgi:hypothetical protein